MVVFGDSSEALSAVSAELMGAIPTTHPHAGEVTEGTMT
jgi:UDP-N-acetylglucosamine 2-epimerase